jgi:hypothetical protein
VRYLIIFLVIVFLPILPGFAQEQITITTYYPAPFGVYRDVDVHNNLTFIDTDGGSDDVVINTDGDGNMMVEATGHDGDYHIIFKDSSGDHPLAYLISYTGAPDPTSCATGYVAVSYIDSSGNPYDTNSAPDPGDIVCLRAY